MSNNDYERLLNIVQYIRKNPSKDEISFFTFDDSNLKFMVAGQKISNLPQEYMKYYSYDEFWLNIDPVERRVMFYACIIGNYKTNERVEQVKGFLDWNKVQAPVLSFLLMYLKELTNSAFPYSDLKISTNDIVSSGPASSHTGYVNREPAKSKTVTSHVYSSEACDERSKFYAKLYDMIKDGRTSIAIDFSNDFINNLLKEKRLEDLNIIFRVLDVDKLNIPIMLEMLNTSKGLGASINERKDFCSKVKKQLNKSGPLSVEYILSKIENIELNVN